MHLDDTDRLKLFKMAHGTLPIMHQKKRFKYSPTDKHPRFGNEEENIMHMFNCQLRNTDKWNEELQDGLKMTEIGPQMHLLILHIINFFATDTDYKISRDYDGLTQVVCFDQHIIS